jgi:hypothetical protein
MLRKMSLVCVVAVALMAGLVHAAPPMPKQVPKDVLVLLEAANLQATAARMKELVAKVAPERAKRIPPIEVLLPMQLFRTGAADSIDLTKPVRSMILAPPLHMQPVFIFTVKNAQAYMGGIMADKKGVVDGVNEFGGPGGEFAVKIVGSVGVLSKNTAAVKKAAAVVAKAGINAKPLLAGADICIGVRVTDSLAAFKEIGMDPFMMAKGALMMFGGMGGPGADPQMAAQMQQMQQMAAHGLDSLEKLTVQIDSFGLAVKFEKNAVEISKTWLPVKDSAVAKFMNATPAGEFKMAKRLPADSSAFFLMRISDPKPLLDWYGGFIGALGGPDADAQAIAKIKAMLAKGAEAWGGELGESVSFRPAATMLIAYAASVKDAAAAKAFARSGAELVNLLAAIQPEGAPKTTVQMTPDAFTHAGVSIDKFTFDITIPVNPNIPPEMAAMPKELMTRLLGEAGYSAVLKDATVTCMGAGAEDGIRAAMDAKTSLAGSGKVTRALIGVKGKPVAVASADVTACVNWALELARILQPALPIPEDLKMGKSTPATFTMVVAPDGVVSNKLRIHHNIITAVKGMVEQAEKAMMGGGGENMLPGPPPPATTLPLPN